ncbi:MAG: efflux RND transporter periplasmic adaptor subunit [Lachnospiraceae bacterium]|nr:efflux RND transporter periplasmic adaptor subunit [Lachnospiraceae bacterium]
MKKSLYKIISAMLASALLLTSCSAPWAKKEEKEEETEVILDVITRLPKTSSITISSDFAASVEADSQVIVIPKVSGEVTEKHFEVGDHVNEGELLFAIDDEAAKIAVTQAENSLKQAEVGYRAQQASTASSIANANETWGKMPTTEQQMQVAVDQSYASAIAAGNTLANAGESVDAANEAVDSAKDTLDDVKDAKKAGLATKSQVEAAEDAVTGAERNVRINENNAETSEFNYYIAQEGYDMALRNQADYNTYTKNSTLFGINAQWVGAEVALTNSEIGIKQAKAALENAKMALDYTKVTAPVSGTITAINVSEHNMASPSVQAYVIESDAKNKISFYVAEESARQIRPGNEAVITKGRERYAARITNVNNILDAATGLFKVEAVADTDALISGTTVSLRTTTRESRNALTVPVNAVYFDGDQPYVLVHENGVAVRKDIVTGLSNADDIEVISGLEFSDEVVVSYSTQLKEGVKLRPSARTEADE